MTPFQALYGGPPPTIPHYHEGFCPVHEVDKNLASRDALLQQLKSNLHAANNRMKQQADAKRKRLPRDDATWENTQELRDKFMNFNLEDKVCVTMGSIDEPRSEPRRSARVAVKNPKYFD